MNKAIFLDRDGVINKEIGTYVWKKDQLIWTPGIKESIEWFKKLNYLIIVITNQSGIAKNLYTNQDVINLHNWIKSIIEIDDFFYCPHSDSDNCDCRKPKPGLILQAIEKYNIDVDFSFLIGDQDIDIQAARSANVAGYKFNQKNLYSFLTGIMF